MALAIVFLGIGIFGAVRAATLPRRTAFGGAGSFDTSMVDGKAVSKWKPKPGITDEDRAKSLGAFGGMIGIGIAAIVIIVAGNKIYLKIYNDHIEGYANMGENTLMGLRAKSVNIPIQQIGEISTKIKGLTPSLTVRTVHGNDISIMMDADKVTEAERLLRQMIYR